MPTYKPYNLVYLIPFFLSNKKKIKKNTFFFKKTCTVQKHVVSLHRRKKIPQGGAVGSSLGSKFLLNL
ncbi:MAG: hypothetical protein RL329_3065 [Bacteroidota bacterium]|jgi:alpha-glucosidase (family GH31 glycosyl hydrolase)